MAMELTCTCGNRLRVAEDAIGRHGQCPVCGRLVQIAPGDSSAPGAGPELDVAQSLTAQPLRPASPPDSTAYSEALLPSYPAECAEPVGDWPDVSRPPYKLYSPGQVGLAAFLGGPVGAFFLMALNYARLEKRGAVWLTAGFGLFTTAAIMAISLALPESVPGPIIAMPIFLVLWATARSLQGSAYDAFLRQGGMPASSWAAAGIALLGLVLYFGVFLGVFLAYDQFLGEGSAARIDFGGGQEVLYSKGATEADARALGALLRQDGYFNGRDPSTVLLSTDGDRMVISFVVLNWVLNDAEMQQQFRRRGQQAAQWALGGRPVEVRLCDELLNVRKKL